MKIHEYQAKEIFSEFSIPVPKGSLARDAKEAKRIAEKDKKDLIIIDVETTGTSIENSPNESLRKSGAVSGL